MTKKTKKIKYRKISCHFGANFLGLKTCLSFNFYGFIVCYETKALINQDQDQDQKI